MNAIGFNSMQVWAYLQLMRPANIVTAWADILVGCTASGAMATLRAGQANPTILVSLVWLLIGTTGLYGGGVVFNDVFDAQLDAQERPERPIPSGRASQKGAALLGSILLGMGIFASFQVSRMSGALAIAIACLALFYDAFGKHHVLGSLNMGMCRGGNWLLGMSILPVAFNQYWFVALLPIVYIAAVTVLSRGEVHGASQTQAIKAVFLIGIVIVGLVGLSFWEDYNLLIALPFIGLLSWRVLRPFTAAVREPTPELIRIAVKAGVLSLIVLDATVAAGFAGWLYGLLVLGLLPLSFGLAKRFAVT